MAGTARYRRSAALLLTTAVALASVQPALAWNEDSVITSISLLDFKKAYGLYTVKKLVDKVDGDGVNFRLNKVDSKGNLIDFSNPGHGKVDVGKSTILFSFNSPGATTAFKQRLSTSIESAMVVYGQTQSASGSISDVFRLTCDVSASGSDGVNAVTCGKGPTVSPS